MNKISYIIEILSFSSLLILTFNCKKENGNPLIPPTVVIDEDSNVYHTVTIGTQTWMVENLKVNTFNDGKPIAYVTDSNEWSELHTPAYCFTNNNELNKEKLGALYNLYAVQTGKLAPKGWHVATENDWITLEE
ncbi:fibrobacter succinogenes major paralogous domain-containing protein [Candidatus Nomurabacteria bacterium]|nr:fibrobacter succinogenes major paralogous domain-containing protein [Candidatus Nomurabacteria bacterium]